MKTFPEASQAGDATSSGRAALVASTASGLDASCRLLDIKEVTDLTGLSKAYIHELIGKGRFPPSIKLGARCSRWRLRDLAAWVDGLQ